MQSLKNVFQLYLKSRIYWLGIAGDLGQTYNSLSTVEHYMQSGGQAILFVGDLSYADRYDYHDVGVRWDSWARFVERIAAYQPWMWSAGNHEIEYMPHMVKSLEYSSYFILQFTNLQLSMYCY